ncbi:MAG: helix-turn-helix domain-containing protein [Bdellovibrionaceae bacterium]|nr:helix-turn-helix domain-containing protein [Pseudobdellovibrionaceae bacterium]
MRKKDLGAFLQTARRKKGLSQIEVAGYLKLQSAQSISDWERNYGSGVPIQSLKQLIKLYGLKDQQVFKLLLDHEFQKLKRCLTEDFYSKPVRRKRRS